MNLGRAGQRGHLIPSRLSNSMLPHCVFDSFEYPTLLLVLLLGQQSVFRTDDHCEGCMTSESGDVKRASIIDDSSSTRSVSPWVKGFILDTLKAMDIGWIIHLRLTRQ